MEGRRLTAKAQHESPCPYAKALMWLAGVLITGFVLASGMWFRTDRNVIIIQQDVKHLTEKVEELRDDQKRRELATFTPLDPWHESQN